VQVKEQSSFYEEKEEKRLLSVCLRRRLGKITGSRGLR